MSHLLKANGSFCLRKEGMYEKPQNARCDRALQKRREKYAAVRFTAALRN